MSSHRGDFLDCKVYIGGLPADATSQEVEDAFHRYGRIRKVWVARRPPGFAFVEYEDNRDAEDAVRALDGTRICGVRARVELSHGRRRNQDGGGFRGGRGGGGRRYSSIPSGVWDGLGRPAQDQASSSKHPNSTLTLKSVPILLEG
uniref:RRM domain-containing protein n=1 Tax=Plectus sambesii TaxID=2011161 RepID=A0A914WUB9_9BILA